MQGCGTELYVGIEISFQHALEIAFEGRGVEEKEVTGGSRRDEETYCEDK
jgi:hypothetical protein